MPPRFTSHLLDIAIWLAAGTYCTLLGFRVVGKKPGESAKYDAWHDRFGKHMRWIGPLMIACNLCSALLR